VPAIRVLIVEDFAPFRQFISSTLGKSRDLQVLGEVSDGLEAVRKAVELKPDLILMDIGLPSLNGIEAARQIRKLVPESKIIFLSQESSVDVVQHALSLGASAYVVKARAGSELLAAFDAAISGKRFVSSSVDQPGHLPSQLSASGFVLASPAAKPNPRKASARAPSAAVTLPDKKTKRDSSLAKCARR
jgi:DNA-binding NarL/FixJ family response regulator